MSTTNHTAALSACYDRILEGHRNEEPMILHALRRIGDPDLLARVFEAERKVIPVVLGLMDDDTRDELIRVVERATRMLTDEDLEDDDEDLELD